MMKHFCASLTLMLKVYTGGIVLIFLLAVVYELNAGRPLSAIALVGLVLIGALFSVQGYSVVDGKLLVHRGGWANTFDLKELRSVEVSPNVIIGSVSLCSTRGFFGLAGYLRNATLGRYRAYVTDGRKAVVLDIGGQKVVLSPDQPEEFAESVRAAQQA
jgi:hypothetical protein